MREFTDVLFLTAIGALLLAFLAFFVPDQNFEILLPIVGAFVGALGGLCFARIAPRPDPAVPESIAALLLAHAYGGTVPQGETVITGVVPWRRNVLAIIVLAAIVVLVLAWLFGATQPVAVLTIAGGFVGLCATIAGDLAKPEPEPAAPASLISEALKASGRAKSS